MKSSKLETSTGGVFFDAGPAVYASAVRLTRPCRRRYRLPKARRLRSLVGRLVALRRTRNSRYRRQQTTTATD